MFTVISMHPEPIDILYCYRNRDTGRIRRSFDSLALQTDKRFNVIFIDYGSDEARSAEVKSLCAAYPFCRYVFVDSRGKIWNRADALNHGFLASQASYMFTSDIDMVFRDSFVSFLHHAATPHRAKFFAVGYLSEMTSRTLNLQQLSKAAYTRSETFALGMVLASREIITKVNGYNSFYSLWGTEDNDLEYRISQAGYTTEFVRHEVLMLHQYHQASGSDRSVLPDGWLQFMKDYHERFKATPFPFRGLSHMTETADRPAKKLFFEQGTIFDPVQARRLFIRHLLITDLLNAAPGAGKAYTFHLNELNSGSFFRLTRFLNACFRKLNIPLTVASTHREQYLSLHDVRDEIYVVLKSLDTQIQDYYLQVSEKEIKLALVKQ